MEKLDRRGRPLTAEEEKLAQLMTVLVRQFEETHYPFGHASPVEALGVLMEDRKLRQRDLIPRDGGQQRDLRHLEWEALDQQDACAQTG
jgi:antitoxin component HigA of HigAB toxin-antitoxin module